MVKRTSGSAGGGRNGGRKAAEGLGGGLKKGNESVGPRLDRCRLHFAVAKLVEVACAVPNASHHLPPVMPTNAGHFSASAGMSAALMGVASSSMDGPYCAASGFSAS